MAKAKFDFMQPIKDIPKTLKGFPKNLVHIVKDPVTNSDEIAARKKEIFPYMYLFGALTLVFFILYVAIPAIKDVMMIVAMIPAFGVIGCVFLLNVLKKAQKKFSDLECPQCKARIQYDNNVQIKVLKKNFIVTKEKSVMSGYDPVDKNTPEYILKRTPMYLYVKGKETTTVEVSCKCQECGTEKTFTTEFVTVECQKFANNVMAIDIDLVMANFEKDVRAEAAEGFENKSGTTERGVEIKYNRGLATLVSGYFGNEIQMR